MVPTLICTENLKKLEVEGNLFIFFPKRDEKWLLQNVTPERGFCFCYILIGWFCRHGAKQESHRGNFGNH